MALQSVFPEDGAVKLSPAEYSALESAKQVCGLLDRIFHEHLNHVSGHLNCIAALSGPVWAPDA